MWLEFLFGFIILWFIWAWYDKTIHKNFPPGPPRLPLLGNLHQVATRMKKYNGNPYVTFKDFSNEYGSIMAIKTGFTWQVILDDPNMIRETLCSEIWSDRPEDPWMLERSFNKPLGILWGNGHTWRELRRFSLRTLRDFGFGKQKGQEAVMQEELEELLTRLNKKIDAEGNVLSMSQFYTVSVLNILWSMVAGTRFSHDDERLQAFVKTMAQVMKLLSASGNVFMAFPFLRHILPTLTGHGKDRKEFIPTLQQKFLDILEERRKQGYYKDDQRDYIDVFLYEIEKNKGTEASKTFSDKQFVITALDLFVAGAETTSNSLEFAMLFMTAYPDVQKKVQEEIDRVVGRSRFPTMSDKPKLPYTEATLLEIQRMANVVPLTARAPTQDTKLGPYDIKKGTFVLFNHYSVHFNNKLWDEPETFRPERFLDSNMKIINTENMIPFGLGKRMCLGEVLARATLFTYFATMMQNYCLKVSPKHGVPCYKNHRFGLTLAPHPFYAVFTQR